MRRSYVYFLLDDRTDPALVKIGRSATPDIRGRALQTAHGHPLRLLGWVPGGAKEERAFHESLKEHHALGEWYRVWPAAVELIETVCEEAERRELEDALERSLVAVRAAKAAQAEPVAHRT